VITKQAAILVGGKGTRLGSLAARIPKPLMPIDEEHVFLDELLFNVARYGFNDILLLAGHFYEQFVSRYDSKIVHGASVRVLVEPTAAGTGGALYNARERLADSFLFANGDTLFDVNFRRLAARLDSSDAVVALALRRVADPGRFGSVDLRGGTVVGFHEKKRVDEAESGLINGGIAIFRREILSFLDHSPCSMETDIYPKLVAGHRIVGEEMFGYFIDIGLPASLAQARTEIPRRRNRPALFLDRDGVLNQDRGYTHRPRDLDWIPGAIESVRCANDIGALVIVVSNQAGVARGLYGISDVESFHTAMLYELARHGAHIDAFYFCPDHPEATIDVYRHPDPPMRKPNPGMILKAFTDWPIDAASSFLVGDKNSDLEAARRVGLPGVLFTGGDLYQTISGRLDVMRRTIAIRDGLAHVGGAT